MAGITYLYGSEHVTYFVYINSRFQTLLNTSFSLLKLSSIPYYNIIV
jgi:hypothetical protein